MEKAEGQRAIYDMWGEIMKGKEIEKQKASLEHLEFDLKELSRSVRLSEGHNPARSTKARATDEIKQLHMEIVAHATVILEKAVRIGQLLTEQKKQMKHGKWMPWIRDNLPFSSATARRYMRLWEKRDMLKLLNVSNLKMAYQITKGDNQVYAWESDDPFASIRYPAPFSHCNELQKRKWVAKWLLQILKDKMDPQDSWEIMEWTAVRFTFDDYFNEKNWEKSRYKWNKPKYKKDCKQTQKQMDAFLEKWKAVDILKLRYTCFNLIWGDS